MASCRTSARTICRTGCASRLYATRCPAEPRLQASLDFVLYLLFFIPGVIALIYAGWDYFLYSWTINEHSNVTANGPPVYQFKAVIPIAGVLVMIQGIAEIFRCVVCMKTGEWPSRLKDAEEIDRSRSLPLKRNVRGALRLITSVRQGVTFLQSLAIGREGCLGFLQRI